MAKKHKEEVFQSRVPKRPKAFLGNGINGLKNVHKRVKKGL